MYLNINRKKLKRVCIETTLLIFVIIFNLGFRDVLKCRKNKIVFEQQKNKGCIVLIKNSFYGRDSDSNVTCDSLCMECDLESKKELLYKEVVVDLDKKNKFAMPTNGLLTSRYGPRGGNFHKGIDLASCIGTPIKASESGIVTFVGYRGSYGYLVEVCHEQGYMTRYAHCSKIYVKAKQEINKGDIIAAVGNTGRSTGPHIHFEILKYGVNKDPLEYLSK